MRKHILYANIFFILFFTATSIGAVEVSVFERTYVRGSGGPITESDTFPGINGLATIIITNGGLEGADYEMVSSFNIVLNGEVIIEEERNKWYKVYVYVDVEDIRDEENKKDIEFKKGWIPKAKVGKI